MKVAVRTFRPIDETIQYCHALDVDQVNLDCSIISGDRSRYWVETEELSTVKSRLKEKGINLSAVTTPPLVSGWFNKGTGTICVYPDKPETSKPLERLLVTIKAMGEAGIDSLLLFSMIDNPEGLAKREDYWQGFLRFYEQIIGQAERYKVKIAAHGHYYPHAILWNAESYERLLKEIPSFYNGVCYDPGILTLAYSDPIDALEKYQSRVHYVHARDVKGRWDMYVEYFLGEGDAQIPKVIQMLKEAKYAGVIQPEHLGPGEPIPKAVEYLKQLIAKDCP